MVLRSMVVGGVLATLALAACSDETDGGASAVEPTGDAGDSTKAPTFTELYGDYLVNPSYPGRCTGGVCHDPGQKHGFDVSSAEAAYASVSHFVVPGAPLLSRLSRL